MPRASPSARRSGLAATMPRRTAARDALIREQLEPLLERAARGEFASLGGEPQAPPGVDHSVRPGAAQCLSRHRRGVRLRSRGAVADRRRPAARRRRRARIRWNACSSIYRWSTPSRWRRRTPPWRRFERLVARGARTTCASYCEYCAGFARKHRDIIAKFGRFPHRNAVLGRESTRGRDRVAGGGAARVRAVRCGVRHRLLEIGA